MSYSQTSTTLGTLAAADNTVDVPLPDMSGQPPLPILHVAAASTTTGATLVLQSRPSATADRWSNVHTMVIDADGDTIVPLDVVLGVSYPAEFRVSAASAGTIVHATTTGGGGGSDEVQTVTIRGADGGTFTLTYSGQTTAAIPYGATAAQVDAALELLSNIGVGDVGVTKSSNVYTVTFTGALADTNVDQLTSTATGLTSKGAGAWTDGSYVCALLTHN